MRTGARSLATLMALTAVAAVWLAVSRTRPWIDLFDPFSFVAFFARALLCFFVVFTWPAVLWFVAVPKISLRLAGGNRDRQRQILQCVIHTPFFARSKGL